MTKFFCFSWSSLHKSLHIPNFVTFNFFKLLKNWLLAKKLSKLDKYLFFVTPFQFHTNYWYHFYLCSVLRENSVVMTSSTSVLFKQFGCSPKSYYFFAFRENLLSLHGFSTVFRYLKFISSVLFSVCSFQQKCVQFSYL